MTEKLEGWAIPITSPVEWTDEVADHTYVVATKNGKTVKRYGCWGRDAGGRKVCDGKGDTGIAECIASKAIIGDDTAGIVYMVNGVCHQTANRILRSSKKTVSGAKAYAASWALYGAYGARTVPARAEWAAIENPCGIKVTDADPLYLSADPEKDTYFDALERARHSVTEAVRIGTAGVVEADIEFQNLELGALIAERIGLDMPDLERRAGAIAGIRRDMLAEHEASMACALRNPDEMIRHADRANAMVNEFLKGAAEILNAREFEAFFDVAPHTTVAVIMPDIVNELIPCASRP